MITIRMLLASLFVLFMVAACGGGGNSSDAFNDSDDDSGSSTSPAAATDLALGTGSGDSFNEGAMQRSPSSGTLSYGGELLVSVNIVDSSNGDELYVDQAVEVSFTSDCVSTGDATIDSTVVTRSGTASATYSAGTCQGDETITARLSTGSSATVSFTIAEQEAGSIAFVSASPGAIALQGNGSGSLPETSELQFMVLDGLGAPMVGRTVQYALSTTLGGITLSADSSVTNDEGVSTVYLQSGSANATVTVEASIENDGGETISTVSGAISIVGALPDQDSFSLSATVLNPGGAGFDGLTSMLTVRAADRNNNPAPSSTSVSFITDAGSIVGACTLQNGKCSVQWESQKPRAADNGIVNILARTIGEESFTDTNGNGLYDDGETILTDLSEAYNDENNNGSYDLGESFSDFNGDGTFTAANGLYDGSNCTDAAVAAGHCANVVEVRDTGILCMSSDAVTISFDGYTGVFDREFEVVLTDSVFGITPPDGTTIEVEGTDLEIIRGDDVSAVPTDQCAVGGYRFPVAVAQSGDTTSGTVVIKVKQRNGQSISSTALSFFF